MPSRRKLLVAAVALISMFGLAKTIGLIRCEPTLEGRTVHSWLRQAANNSYCNFPATCEAVSVFERNGSRAVPSLIRIIEKPPSLTLGWLRNHRVLFDRLPSGLRSKLDNYLSDEILDRSWAIMMCADIGSEAKSANPALVNACRDPEWAVRREAAKALPKTGVPPVVAVPILAQMMLRDSYYEVRAWAASSLGLLVEKSQAAIPALRQATNDPNGWPASWAREALERVENADMP